VTETFGSSFLPVGFVVKVNISAGFRGFWLVLMQNLAYQSLYIGIAFLQGLYCGYNRLPADDE